MSETPITPTPTEPPVATATPPVPTPPPVVDPTDIDGFKNLVGKLREEIKAVKADRTPQDEKDAKAIAALKRQLESTPSPEDIKKEVTQSIAKALGLVDDDSSDPAKLTAKLTDAQAAAQQARVELAIFKTAAAAGGDPSQLLDSESFKRSLASIDISDAAAVQAAIVAAVEANPRLGAAPGIRTPAPNPAQGSSAAGPSSASQLSEQDVDRLMREGKHDEVEKARIEGRLNDLLGIK